MEMQGAVWSDLMVDGRAVPLSIVYLLTFLPRRSNFIHQRGKPKMKRVPKSGSSVLTGVLLILAVATLYATDRAVGSVQQQFKSQQGLVESREDYRKLFTSIQRNLASGNISSLAQHLAPQVQVNFRGGENGYYSANQAYYLLDNYFRSRKILGFEFSTIGESDSNPYATGGASFNYKGSREYAQVYVSLSRTGRQWLITQINIY